MGGCWRCDDGNHPKAVLELVQKSMHTMQINLCGVHGIQFIFTYRKVVKKRKVLEISTTLIDMHVFMRFCARPNTKILALHSCELRQKQCAWNVAYVTSPDLATRSTACGQNRGSH